MNAAEKEKKKTQRPKTTAGRLKWKAYLPVSGIFK